MRLSGTRRRIGHGPHHAAGPANQVPDYADELVNRPARALSELDRRRLWSSLEAHGGRTFASARLLAIATLTLDTGLRLREVVALELEQVVELLEAKEPRIVAALHLRKAQAKGRAGGYTSAGLVAIPVRSRAALRAYLRLCRARGWLAAPPWSGPVWLTARGAHALVGRRAIQLAWQTAQARAGIRDPYRWHDLRHTAITRWAAAATDPYVVAELARHRDVRTTMRYVHTSPARLAEIAERASRT